MAYARAPMMAARLRRFLPLDGVRITAKF